MNTTESKFCKNAGALCSFDDPVLIAFSGGCDSLALLALSSVFFKNIHAVYVNHNLRSEEELKTEISLNEKNCVFLKVPFDVVTIERGEVERISRLRGCGTEAAARYLRYEILERKRMEYRASWIFTAHHEDDQIETVYMRMQQKGLVPSLRGIAQKKGNLVRPLLAFRRAELEDYVAYRGLSYSSDSTNKDNSIKRNYYRNIVLPSLKQNPEFEKNILEIRKNAVDECSGFEMPVYPFEIKTFNSLSYAHKILALYELWDCKTEESMPQTLVRRILDLCSAKKNGVVSANGASFELCDGFLYFALDDDMDFTAKISDEVIMPYGIVFGKVTQNISKTDILLNLSTLPEDAVLRFAKQGDRISLKDGSKTVLSLLKDMKVPRIMRGRIPVIADGDNVLVVFAWVCGKNNRICRALRTDCTDGTARFNCSSLCL